jgi:hypothetical protein
MHKAYVYSEQGDEIVIPAQENIELDGAVSISVQRIYPLQLPDHFLMLINSVAFAITRSHLML